MSYDEDTQEYSLVISRDEIWAILECLQPHFAGFSHRAETAEPWHGLALMRKVIEGIALGESRQIETFTLNLTLKELLSLIYHVPASAFETSRQIITQAAILIAQAKNPQKQSESYPPEVIDSFTKWWSDNVQGSGA